MKRLKAFTLVEVLVVISVTALLLSIGLPSLRMARECGKSVVCLSNLRQMSIAAEVYSSQSNGFYPLASFLDYDDFSCQKEWDFTRIFEAGEMKDCQGGFLWPTGGTLQIQQCPSFRGNANSPGDPFTGYNYNASYIGGILVRSAGDITGSNSTKVTQVSRPSVCAMFGDGQFILGANKFMRSPQVGRLDSDFSNAYRYSGTQGFRHLGKTNVTYCDSSAKSVSRIYTETKSKDIIEQYNEEGTVKTGFLSADNSAYDLK